MPNIELMSPASGRMIKEDNTVVNIADILDRLDTIYILSTEPKPTGAAKGKKLLELDTGNAYVYYNSTWYQL